MTAHCMKFQTTKNFYSANFATPSTVLIYRSRKRIRWHLKLKFWVNYYNRKIIIRKEFSLNRLSFHN